MENNEQQELLQEIAKVHIMVQENPCGMKPFVLRSLTEVLHSFIGKYCIESASKDQVAKYFNRDVRTITRWQQQYPDFPKPRHEGHHEVSYNWEEVITWKLNHKDLLK